jgi:hypothetical protein
MSCKKPRSRQRFQQGINPHTGLNERDFRAGNYVHEVVKGLVQESLEAVLVPAGYTLDFMDFWYQPEDPPDPIVRLIITPPAAPQETHDVRVNDEGGRPWAGQTGPILVAWVKERYAL